eukprot:7181684-Prymnesium_polylepis.1
MGEYLCSHTSRGRPSVPVNTLRETDGLKHNAPVNMLRETDGTWDNGYTRRTPSSRSSPRISAVSLRR